MTDKSFGDHYNRNVVKNPLLSTAVTGLSIEDLTHNAVLLPVSLSQEVITRPEQQNRPQTGALQLTEHAVSSYPAGDAKSNIFPSQLSSTTSSSTIYSQNPLKTQEMFERLTSTAPKALVKSEDDFDVNEYFARLHGTRYVSAPFNIALKEDKNANLEATEENLEEINLNEPEKQVDVQQSLTADIAQNFSQLPTVLPQVASAVFSSFSSMLQTRKSREPTPDVSSGYQEVQFERPSEPKEVLPPPRNPPKEPLTVPPSVGTSNYRLPPKKKYAQIPGLSSGDTTQSPYLPFSQSFPTNENIPQYFVPSSLPNEQNITGQDIQNSNLSQTQAVQNSAPTYFTPAASEDISRKKTSIEISNTSENDSKVDIFNVAAQNIPDAKDSTRNEVNLFPSNVHASQVQFYSQDPSQASVLPPPPMFANQPRTDSHIAAGKTFLPPSVARRIGASQPVIKEVYQVPSFTENIFIPTPIDSSGNNATVPQKSESSALLPSNIIQSAYTQFNAQTPVPLQSSVPSNISFSGPVDAPAMSKTAVPHASQLLEKTQEIESRSSIFPSSTITPPALGMMKSIEVSGPPSSILMHSSIAPPPFFATKSAAVSAPSVPPSNYKPDILMNTNIAAQFPPSNLQALSQIPPSIFTPPSSTAAAAILSPSRDMLPPKTSTVLPQIFTPAKDFEPSNNLASLSNQIQRTLPPPPMYYDPNVVTAETKEFPPINKQIAPTPEPSKSVPEPPKASGPINYRMTKKRPQYYAGPIEGVGAISNNVKPVIAPVNTGSFQGDLFTPQQESTNENQVTQNIGQYTEQSPFDISRPSEHTYSNVASQPQAEDYNTIFDTSRPVTESYIEPKQESSGFGLLGSLKSKLGALDINKIQNTVTTFFDPTYNDTKKDSSNIQENVTYRQQQYGNTESNSFEIFVPNVEQAVPAFEYNYQTAYQSQYNHKLPPQQYQNSQIAQQYYQNPAQNASNYFSDADMHRYQYPAGTSTPCVNTPIENQEIVQTQMYHTVPKSQEEINASKQPDIEIQRSYSIRPPYQRNEQSFKPQQTPFDPLQIQLSNVDSKTVEYVNQPEVLDSTKLLTDANNLFTGPLSNIDSPKNSISRGNQQITDNFALEPLPKNSLDQFIPLTELSATSQEHPHPTNTLGQQNAQNITREPITDKAHSFFDNPSLQTISKEAPVPQNVITQKRSESREFIYESGANFFESPPKAKLEAQTNENIRIPKNIGFELTQQPNLEQENVLNPNDRLGDDLQNVMSSLQTNPADFFSSLNPGDSKIQSIFSSAFDFNKSEITEQQGSKVITDWPEQPRPLGMSSAPLFGLSTMLANKTKELHDLETEMKNLSIQESANEPSYIESLKTEREDDKENGPELNICETCREVNKPDEWEREETDDLTTQLIENITSPIQLSNPVEVPLTESNTPADDELDDFDRNQCEEISHITEETIEAIQVQVATELLDDDQKVRDYGWSNEEVTYPVKLQEERDLTFEQPTGLEQHNYGLPVISHAIGFIGSKSLYENSPDKLKKDFESQENVTKVLPRQMSEPSAPPEEDLKSEALDVHSIEQDASKDFPIFEEFVIEPDVGDDNSDNIEEELTKIDSFSSRVDNYKKKEEHDAFPKISPTFMLPSTTSPTIMPSYFDTGNYAADTHYRNSLTTPTSNFTFGSQNQISVPPGFEEEFRRRLSTHDAFASKIDEPFIPDTSTQTKVTNSPTFSTAHHDTCVTTASTISTIQDRGSDIASLPDIKSVFSVKNDLAQEFASTGSVMNQLLTRSDLHTLKKEENFQIIGPKTLEFSSFSSDNQGNPAPVASIFETSKLNLKSGPIPLPDPINFFASSSEPVQKLHAHDLGVNRLASYFSSPEKPDHSKSFFELSQSQNHYRQLLTTDSSVIKSPGDSKPFINPILTASNVIDKLNIPQEQYVANLNLMRDLTSIQQAEFKPEQVVRTINYFTIEYDNERLVSDIAKSASLNKGSQFDNTIDPIVSDGKIDDGSLMTALNKCKHCCDLTVGYVDHLKRIHGELTDFKVKKCMDGNKQSKNNNNMESKGNSLENKTSTTVNIDKLLTKEEPNDGVSVATEARISPEYIPVRYHWFYRVDVDGKSNWRGFSVADSQALENAYQSPDLSESTVVATDGGRFDVNINGRLRVPVYWNENPTNVRRCSWFYKGTTDARYVPYTEAVAEKLEVEYRHGMTTGEWHRRLVLPNNEMVVMHGPAVMVHFLQAQNTDAFSAPPQSTMRPRVVRRGHDESEIEEMEPSSIDHLLLLCHGVGSACDMRFRNVEEVVDEFRATSLQLIQSHYKESYDTGRIGRVEVLPISWHATLHSGETGVDTRLARITLESIPRLRSFTNDTVLDVLFYTSPVFCQTIINTVCAELNRIYKLFLERNPSFKGGVSLGGHSLGSVIIYDLLCHQLPKEAAPSSSSSTDKRYVKGAAGTGQPSVNYPTLDFAPIAMYALGSPIAIFECIRGVDFLGSDFSLPTCKNFFNVFHPYDPIAYRIEPLINPALREYKPFLIPHHKGRKRMHLELKDTMARVGADIKQKLLESFGRTWSNMWRSAPPAADGALDKVVEEELEKDSLTASEKEELPSQAEPSVGMLGRLNSGRRVDYVLQEAPLEMINEYLFAMSSHVCYWESEDTMLLMLREIYDALGVRPDSTVPQQSLTVERARTLPSDDSEYANADYPSTSKGPS